MSEFRRRLLAKKDELKENEILAVYNVTTTESATTLLGGINMSNIEAMSIDGVNITPARTFTFSKIGDVEVRIKIKQNVTALVNLFHNCTRLVCILYFNTTALNLNNVFSGCRNLVAIEKFNIPNALNIGGLFYLCEKLIEIPKLPNNEYTNVSGCFAGCYLITTIQFINTRLCTSFSQFAYLSSKITTFPQYDTSNVTNFTSCCSGVTSLITVPLLDFSNATKSTYIFLNCGKLANLGGFKNLKIDMSITSSNLTAVSVHNIINEALGGFTLTLSPTAKTNWQNSEYYNADQAMADEKLITIQ